MNNKNLLITKNMLEREFMRVIAAEFDMDEFPSVCVVIGQFGETMDLLVVWNGLMHGFKVSQFDLVRSLDDFCERFILPAVMEMCGRPLLDYKNRPIFNPVHDAPTLA